MKMEEEKCKIGESCAPTKMSSDMFCMKITIREAARNPEFQEWIEIMKERAENKRAREQGWSDEAKRAYTACWLSGRDLE